MIYLLSIDWAHCPSGCHWLSACFSQCAPSRTQELLPAPTADCTVHAKDRAAPGLYGHLLLYSRPSVQLPLVLLPQTDLFGRKGRSGFIHCWQRFQQVNPFTSGWFGMGDSSEGGDSLLPTRQGNGITWGHQSQAS